MQDETLVWFGGSVKALDNKGLIGGHLILFGSPNATDASKFRDYFTKETDFALDVTTKSRVLYQHALDPTLGNRSLGVGSLKMDDAGIWLKAQLNLRDEYERKIFEMVEAGKLGFSSGTASHLIRREAQANGASKILAWPLGLDASLTPNPAEPRTQAVALKSLHLEGIKGEHLGPYSESSAAMEAVRSLLADLSSLVFGRLADPQLPAAEKLAQCRAGFDEAQTTALRLIGALIPPAPEAADGATKTVAADELLRMESLFHANMARFALAD